MIQARHALSAVADTCSLAEMQLLGDPKELSLTYQI
jgi:hypothetical protein